MITQEERQQALEWLEHLDNRAEARIAFWIKDGSSLDELAVRVELKKIRTLKSLLTEERREWMPIESAPKNGREQMLIIGRLITIPQLCYSNTWWQGGFSHGYAPTHWMPVPIPPLNNLESDK